MSTEVLCVLAGVCPWDYIAREYETIFKKTMEIQKDRDVNSEDKNEIINDMKEKTKENTAQLWQQEWENCIKGRWTFKIIPKAED